MVSFVKSSRTNIGGYTKYSIALKTGNEFSYKELINNNRPELIESIICSVTDWTTSGARKSLFLQKLVSDLSLNLNQFHQNRVRVTKSVAKILNREKVLYNLSNALNEDFEIFDCDFDTLKSVTIEPKCSFDDQLDGNPLIKLSFKFDSLIILNIEIKNPPRQKSMEELTRKYKNNLGCTN